MLTEPQFRAQLKAINSSLSRFKKSSMEPTLTAIATWQGAQNNANLLAVFQALDAVPAAKKQKYAAAINGLEQSIGNLYYTVPATLVAAGNGIGLGRGGIARPGFRAAAISALRQLEMVPAGANLITVINAQIGASGKRVGIQPWDAQAANKCHVFGPADNVKANLALAVEFQRNNVGVAIAACLASLGQNGGGAHAWLQGQIDNCPIYDIQTVPAGMAGSQATHGAGWISAAMITNWVNGATVFPAPLANQQARDAELVLVSVLQAGMTAGVGEHSIVRWDPSSLQFVDTQGAVQVRPPYLALAHELVHAYHNISGTQTGHEIGTPSRVLYEFLCIGLGPWQNAAVSENRVRNSAGLPARTCY